MMGSARPSYETPIDRVNEMDVMRYVSDKYSMTIEPHEEHAVFDYWAVRSKPSKKTGRTALNVEIKCRGIKWGKYPTIMLSALKFAHGMRMIHMKRADFMFIVQAKDKMMAYVADPSDLPRILNAWGGRQDRDDHLDEEWVVHIPIDLFVELADHDVTKAGAGETPEAP